MVIETDDQRADDLSAMPRTRALIGGEGVEFANSVVSLSECCPSRATFLTGRYAHNHGVWSSRPPLGGFGRLDSPRLHQTDAITERSLAFIRRRSGDAPFFLWTNYVAPHTGRPRDLADPTDIDSTVPADRHRTAFLGALLPRPPSFDEADVSDKPPAIRSRARIKQWRIAALAETRRQRLASLLAVDEGVARIVASLREAGELGDTLLIFTSDNGFMAGEHRVPGGKVLPYEPSIRVPLLMRGPGIPRGARREQLVWNGDLAPTILEATGARAPFALDGRSLMPFVHGAREDRAVLLQGPPKPGSNGMPRFTGLRTAHYKYVEHLWGARELYDLRTDPDELENLAPSPLQRRLARRLARLRSCAGAACRR